MPTSQLPADGEWPCQQVPLASTAEMFPRLHAFLYRLLRDGAQAPGDVEHHALQARDAKQGLVQYTNPHLEKYADSLATFLLGGGALDAQIHELTSGVSPDDGARSGE